MPPGLASVIVQTQAFFTVLFAAMALGERPARRQVIGMAAALVDPRLQPRDQVRFGASVTLRTVSGERAGEERRLEIVGIDEADAAHGRVAFTAPIARAILGREVGDTAALDTRVAGTCWRWCPSTTTARHDMPS